MRISRVEFAAQVEITMQTQPVTVHDITELNYAPL